MGTPKHSTLNAKCLDVGHFTEMTQISCFIGKSGDMSCPIKGNSNTNELTVHTSCNYVLDLLCVSCNVDSTILYLGLVN